MKLWLAGCALHLGASNAASPLWAMSKAEATNLVDKLVADINKVVASGKSDAKMFADFERIFGTYADVPDHRPVRFGG